MRDAIMKVSLKKPQINCAKIEKRLLIGQENSEKKGIKTINRGKQVKTRVEIESPSGVYKKSTTNWWKPGTDIESIEKASRNSMLKDAIKAEKEHLKNKADWNNAFSAEKIKDAFNVKRNLEKDFQKEI